MHNIVNVMMFIWMPFSFGFFSSPRWVWSEGLSLIFTCQDCSFVWFYANMNYVHCIDAKEEELEADIVMYLNFRSMF